MKNPVVVTMEVNIHEYGMSLREFQKAVKDKEWEFLMAVGRHATQNPDSLGKIRQKIFIENRTLIVKMVYGGD